MSEQGFSVTKKQWDDLNAQLLAAKERLAAYEKARPEDANVRSALEGVEQCVNFYVAVDDDDAMVIARALRAAWKSIADEKARADALLKSPDGDVCADCLAKRDEWEARAADLASQVEALARVVKAERNVWDENTNKMGLFDTDISIADLKSKQNDAKEEK